jgi:hypothetical protein
MRWRSGGRGRLGLELGVDIGTPFAVIVLKAKMCACKVEGFSHVPALFGVGSAGTWLPTPKLKPSKRTYD